MKFYFEILATMLLVVASKVAAQTFEPLDDVPQDTSVVKLPPNCPTKGKVANTMFTFEVSSSGMTEVSSFPKDLVTMFAVDEELVFTWGDAAYDSKEGGVRIAYPAVELTELKMAASSVAQILDGFTALEKIEVSSSADLHATLTSMNTTGLEVVVSSSAKAKIVTNALLKKVEVSSSANVELEGATEDLQVSSSGKLSMKGNVKAGSVSSSANVHIEGNVNGDLGVSSSGKLQLKGDIVGSIDASSSAKVETTSSCDNVEISSSAKCSVTDVDPVSVSVSELPFTRTGTSTCSSNAPASSFRFPLAGLVAGLVLTFGFAI